MNLTLTVGANPARTWTANELSGYHRPLASEAANLTLSLALAPAQRSDWADPPLGEEVVVTADGVTLLEGVLTGLHWTRADLTVQVEG